MSKETPILSLNKLPKVRSKNNLDLSKAWKAMFCREILHSLDRSRVKIFIELAHHSNMHCAHTGPDVSAELFTKDQVEQKVD